MKKIEFIESNTFSEVYLKLRQKFLSIPKKITVSDKDKEVISNLNEKLL